MKIPDSFIPGNNSVLIFGHQYTLKYYSLVLVPILYIIKLYIYTHKHTDIYISTYIYIYVYIYIYIYTASVINITKVLMV